MADAENTESPQALEDAEERAGGQCPDHEIHNVVRWHGGQRSDPAPASRPVRAQYYLPHPPTPPLRRRRASSGHADWLHGEQSSVLKVHGVTISVYFGPT